MELTQQFSSRLTTHRQATAITILWAIALIGLVQAELSRAHLGLAQDWFSMMFYFSIPALLWTVVFPILKRYYNSIVIGRNWKNWCIHLTLSFVIAFTLKFAALTIDFIIQSGLGMMHGSLKDFLIESKFLLLSSLVDNVFIYWALIIFIHFNSDIINRVAKGQALEYPQSLKVKTEEGAAMQVPLINIIFFEAYGNYLKVHTQQKVFCIRGTIKSISGSLSPNQFHRVHRSIIVNGVFIKSVKSIGQGNFHLELNDNKAIRTGRQYKESVKLLLPKFAGYA
jgi:hypothetical protein